MPQTSQTALKIIGTIKKTADSQMSEKEMTAGKSKANRLVELVKGKTLLKEAPTRREIILHVYGVDIGDIPVVTGWKKSQKISEEETNRRAIAWSMNRKLSALIRSVRKAEYNVLGRAGKLDSIHSNNNYQYYMVQDDNGGVWRCVHIINKINGDYLLKHNKAQEKTIESMERTAQKLKENVSRSQEERDALEKEELKRRFKRRYAKQCPPKEIRKQIAQLRQQEKLPQSKKDYRPNIEGIQHVYTENAVKIKQAMIDYELKHTTEKAYFNEDDILANMIKEIILCDYYKRDYILPEPKKPLDYLGILKSDDSITISEDKASQAAEIKRDEMR